MAEYIIPILLVFVSVTVVFINTLFIVIICRSKKIRKKPSTVFTLNLLATQLLQGLFVIPFYIAKRQGTEQEQIRRFICDGFRFPYMITFYGTCIHVVLITTDRLLAVILLTSYKLTVTFYHSVYVTIVAWVYIILLCLVPFLPQKQPESVCSYIPQKEWIIFMLLVNTLASYVYIVMVYIYIYQKLAEIATRKKKHSISSTSSTCSRSGAGISRTFMKQCFIITLSYGLTWAPAVVYYLLQVFTPSVFSTSYSNSKFEEYVSFFIKFITTITAIISPIVYCYFNSEFQREYKFTMRALTSCNRTNDRNNWQGDITVTNIDERQSEQPTNYIQ